MVNTLSPIDGRRFSACRQHIAEQTAIRSKVDTRPDDLLNLLNRRDALSRSRRFADNNAVSAWGEFA